MSNDSKRLLAFGAFELDRDEGLLFRAGEHVPLPPKALQTLVVLVESGGRLLTKDELMRAIWADTFVEEHNLTLNIHILRKALNHNGGADRYIETVPRRGYRFIAPVRETTRAPQDATVGPPPPAVESRRPGMVWVAAIIAAAVLVAGTLAASRLLARRTDLDAGPAVIRLTNNIADDRQPDVSPDGRHIVFVTNRDGGKGEIYVMDAVGGNPRNLTQHPSNDDTPAWSPDGRRIAFQSDRRGPIELFVMDADGGHPTPLTPGARAAWSPDGTRIAYQLSVDHHPDVFTIDVTGGAAQRVTFDRDFAADPSWSPDGTRLAFTAARNHKLQIDVMRLDGTGRTTLTDRGNNRVPAWSPDGRRILFSSDRDGPEALYVMEADGSVQHRVDPQSGEGAWWPDGRAIVFESDRDGNTELYRRRLDREPDGAARLTSHVATDDHPSWSRDGRLIAFDSNRDGKPNIFVMDPDGGQIRNLTRSGASDAQPAWSSNDASIAFASDRGGTLAIYAIRADGSGLRRLTEGHGDSAPQWSPDDRSICFSRDRGIWTAPVAGGPPRRLASGETCSWSPDGSHVTFDRDADGVREIYSVPAGGGDAVCLSRNGHGNGGPAWSRDGLRIAFNSNQDGFGFGIFVMTRDGSGQGGEPAPGGARRVPGGVPGGSGEPLAARGGGNRGDLQGRGALRPGNQPLSSVLHLKREASS